MPGLRGILALAGMLLALLPAAAAAQSAGDEQYQDPFGGQQSQPQAKPNTTPAPPPAPAPAPAAPAPAAPAPAAPAPAATTQSGAQAAPAELPRTGRDARLPALLGLVLLSAGVALRAHARRDT